MNKQLSNNNFFIYFFFSFFKSKVICTPYYKKYVKKLGEILKLGIKKPNLSTGFFNYEEILSSINKAVL